MASPVLKLNSVSLNFGQDVVLKNIDLSVYESEIFVIMGPSGHGKSTLLKVMAGILEPSSGEVWIEGQNFYKLDSSKRDLLRRKMGMLFQKNALFDSLTAEENVGFPIKETTHNSPEMISEKVTNFLEVVGLADSRKKYPDEISGGMQKRLGIARALALDPEIIFYDDPTAGLDPITSRKIIDLILYFKNKKGATSVAITNDVNRAVQMASRMGMIFNGELIITGTPAETKVYSDPRVQQFIGGLLRGPLTEPE